MTGSMLPYSLNDLAAGAVRVIVHPISTTLFTSPVGAFAQEGADDYAPTAGGIDLGATTGPIAFDRNATTQSFKIEQSTADVLETPDEMIRQIHIPMGQISMANLGIFENSSAISTIAAASGHSEFDTLEAGDIQDLTAYRVTVVGMHQKSQGIVIEDDATERGRFYGFIAYRATFTADTSTISFGKGALASMTVTLKLYPDPTIADTAKNQIKHFSERAGTIA